MTLLSQLGGHLFQICIHLSLGKKMENAHTQDSSSLLLPSNVFHLHIEGREKWLGTI
jgi:hypothetical protein